MKHIKIFRAADAFLYLPTYIAERKKIYHAIDSNLQVEFETPGGTDSGDTVALSSLLEHQRNGSETIPIALCDPLSIFSDGFKTNRSKFRIIGALITKPPFWAVNSIPEEINDESVIAKRFSQVIYYNDQLITGNFIGRRFCKHTNSAKGIPVNFGEEITCLVKEKSKANNRHTVAVTADLVSLAQGVCRENLAINHRFSKNTFYENFLTTALITTDDYCNEFEPYITKIIRGIQGAFLMMRQSKEIAYEVCKEVSTSPNVRIYRDGQDQMDEKELRWVVDLIHQESFYPASMEVTPRQWNAAINARAKAAMWETEEMNQCINGFSTYIDNRFLMKSREEYAKEIGIVVPRVNNTDNSNAVFIGLLNILFCRYAHKLIQWAHCIFTITFIGTLLISALDIFKPQNIYLAQLKLSSFIGIFSITMFSSFWHPSLKKVIQPLASKRSIRIIFLILLFLATGVGAYITYSAQDPKIHEWSVIMFSAGIAQVIGIIWEIIKSDK